MQKYIVLKMGKLKWNIKKCSVTQSKSSKGQRNKKAEKIRKKNN